MPASAMVNGLAKVLIKLVNFDPNYSYRAVTARKALAVTELNQQLPSSLANKAIRDR